MTVVEDFESPLVARQLEVADAGAGREREVARVEELVLAVEAAVPGMVT